jgi:hypothetical protein
MNPFRVWIRPLQSASKLRVEGAGNATWLLERLSRSFFFKSSQPVVLDADSLSSFEVPFGADYSGAPLRVFLGKIPEIRLMREPA